MFVRQLDHAGGKLSYRIYWLFQGPGAWWGGCCWDCHPQITGVWQIWAVCNSHCFPLVGDDFDYIKTGRHTIGFVWISRITTKSWIMEQTQRHAELQWLWPSHPCYIEYLEGHLRAFHGLAPTPWSARIPEVTELVASTIAGTFLARFGCIISSPSSPDNNFWNVPFPCLDQEKANLFPFFFSVLLFLEE